MRLGVTGATHLRLLREARVLLLGVVQLRVAVADLHTAAEHLEALGQRRVAGHAARQRRQLDRVVDQEGRLDQVRLDEVRQRVVDELRPGLVGARLELRRHQRAAQGRLVARAGERVEAEVPREGGPERQPAPRRLQIDHLALPRDLGGPERLLRGVRDHLLRHAHDVLVVDVGLVRLEHRELGVVLVRHALVAEVLAQLVHLLEPADDEALQVQLGGNPQVQVAAQFVVVRRERPRQRAAVERLQHRCLDLEEAPPVEEPAEGRDGPRAHGEQLTRLG